MGARRQSVTRFRGALRQPRSVPDLAAAVVARQVARRQLPTGWRADASPSELLVRADAAGRAGRVDEERALVAGVLASFGATSPVRAIAFYRLGQLLADPVQAILMYDAVLAEKAADPRLQAKAHCGRGFRLQSLGRLPDAEASFAAALAAAPPPAADPEGDVYVAAWLGLAEIRGARGDRDGQRAALDRAVEVNAGPPFNRATARIARARRHLSDGRYGPAAQDLSAAVDTPGVPPAVRARALVLRGNAMALAGDPEAALADFTAVAGDAGAPAEQRAWALDRRSIIRRQRGDAAAEEFDLRTAYSLASGSPWIRAQAAFGLGCVAWRKGDRPQALAFYNEALGVPAAKLEPGTHARALNNRGLVHLADGRLSAAIADFDAALADPDAPPDATANALINRGRARETQGDAAAALADFDTALRVADLEPVQRLLAQARRGDVLVRLGRDDEALAALDDVIGSPDADDWLRRQALTQRAKFHQRRGDLVRAAGDLAAANRFGGATRDRPASTFGSSENSAWGADAGPASDTFYATTAGR